MAIADWFCNSPVTYNLFQFFFIFFMSNIDMVVGIYDFDAYFSISKMMLIDF